MSQFPAPMPHPAIDEAVRHKKQSVILPVVFIVIGALGTLGGMTVVFDRPFQQSLLAIIPFTIVLLLGVWFLNWIDRWEPEPPHYVIGAFLWGAGVSALISGIFNTIFLTVTQSMALTAMFSAPFIEESTKAAFLIVILLATRHGRAEFNSLTDALVYGGMVGLGFAWIEHIGYVLMADSWELAAGTLFVRLIFVSYLHPILTMIVAIGIWKGVNSRGLARFGWPFVGWLVAVVLHFLHNGGAIVFLGDIGLLVVAAVELCVFIWLIRLGLKSKKREQEEIVRQLPAMVHFGWITPLEAGWLADKGARKAYIKMSEDQSRTLKDFIQNVTELALLRGRLDTTQGQPSTEWLQMHGELASLVSHQRPIVHSILTRRSPGVTPMGGAPGPNWGAPRF